MKNKIVLLISIIIILILGINLLINMRSNYIVVNILFIIITIFKLFQIGITIRRNCK